MRTPVLLDANVAIALTVAEHEHHAVAVDWFDSVGSVTLCPITEGALLRFLLRMGESIGTASHFVRALLRHPKVEFMADDVSYVTVDLDGLRGHRQATDAYLAGLASAHGTVLATFDAALASWRPASTVLIARP